MIYIDINKIQISNDKWPTKSAELLTRLKAARTSEEINTIIDKNHGYWKVFKDQLKKISFNKCWYSESKNPYSYYHVDHFRPKNKVIEYDGSERDGYWWLAFEHTNFRLSGSVGNTKKANHFAVKKNTVTTPVSIKDEVCYFIDPTKKEDVTLLNFQEDGHVIESAPEDEAPWDFTRANYTIEKLDLNYPDLVEARMQKWVDTTILIKRINKKIRENNEEQSATILAEIEGLKNECRKLIQFKSEFAATSRACLRSTGKIWAFSLLEENLELDTA
jgi:uncharacterized protein (TIGR02646 family)